MVDAEWLLKNHSNLLDIERALVCRIRQLRKEGNTDEVIEGLELSGNTWDGMPHAKAIISRTESVAENYQEVLDQELQQLNEEMNHLYESLRATREKLMLYDVVIAGLNSTERWIVDSYYEKGYSIDTMLDELKHRDIYISKSTLRRKRIQVVQKATRTIEMISHGKMV